MFLGEWGLAFRGDPNNGNFLGILELISHYDQILGDHLSKVKESQQSHRCLQVHYLSAKIQNEFIVCCANYLKQVILAEIIKTKYYSIIVDATPDSSHVEQTAFILRYVHCKDNVTYEVQERFLEFVDCNHKTGEAIVELINETLRKYGIPLTDCRGQGYDNGSNMSSAYKGAQAHIIQNNQSARFCPCACCSLNLCGV